MFSQLYVVWNIWNLWLFYKLHSTNRHFCPYLKPLSQSESFMQISHHGPPNPLRAYQNYNYLPLRLSAIMHQNCDYEPFLAFFKSYANNFNESMEKLIFLHEIFIVFMKNWNWNVSKNVNIDCQFSFNTSTKFWRFSYQHIGMASSFSKILSSWDIFQLN